MSVVAEDIEPTTTSRLSGEGRDELEEGRPESPILHETQPPRRHEWEFKRRHIEFMTLGGTVGIGIYLKSAQALFLGGPVAMNIAYLFVGSVAYAVAVSVGEMTSVLPIPGALFVLPGRILSPSIGFACGWAFWFSCATIVPNEVVAMQEIINFWTSTQKVPEWAWILIFILLPLAFNFLNVRKYGEVEYWITMIKILTLVALILLGISLLPLGASSSEPLLGTTGIDPEFCLPSNGSCLSSPGFNYWREEPFREIIVGGPTGRLVGFWECCCRAVFGYIGVESLGITASEAENPRRNLPKAARKIGKRLVFYYVAAATTLSLNLSANDPILGAAFRDPNINYGGAFVLMLRRWGLEKLSYVVNGVGLIAAFGVANVFLYLATRTLYALAVEGWAPEVFQRTSSRTSVPMWALFASSLPSLMAFMALRVESSRIFQFLSEMSSTASLASWVVICATYLRWRSALVKRRMERMVDRDARSIGQPYLAIYALIASGLFFILGGYQVFLRGALFWELYTFAWGYTLAPYAVFSLFIILIVGRLLKIRVAEGIWSWEIPPISKIDLTNGAAGPYRRRHIPRWEELLEAILKYP